MASASRSRSASPVARATRSIPCRNRSPASSARMVLCRCVALAAGLRAVRRNASLREAAVVRPAEPTGPALRRPLRTGPPMSADFTVRQGGALSGTRSPATACCSCAASARTCC